MSYRCIQCGATATDGIYPEGPCPKAMRGYTAHTMTLSRQAGRPDPDPRDAEIAALREQVRVLREALLGRARKCEHYYGVECGKLATWWCAKDETFPRCDQHRTDKYAVRHATTRTPWADALAATEAKS